jgi:hypothetical protein
MVKRFKVQGSRFKVQGSRFKVHESEKAMGYGLRTIFVLFVP